MPITIQPLPRLVTLATQPKRIIIGLVGLPGSGKTTLATQLQQQCAHQTPTINLTVLSMDGFHLSKAQLAQQPDPEQALARRGAPWTFDATGLVQKIRQLKAHTGTVTWPIFEHAVGDPVADAIEVTPYNQLILIEGLYLLYREDDWRGLDGLFDEIWYLDTAPELAEQRLINRHQQAWGLTSEQARARIASNDAKNAALVFNRRMGADYFVAS